MVFLVGTATFLDTHPSKFILMDLYLFEGRQMIEQTKKLVEDKFTTLGGYEYNAEVHFQIITRCIEKNE